jgi:glycosyltransferase involved in cell wall biosynthesis
MKIAVNTRFLLPGQLEGIGWFTYEVVKRMVEQHPEDEFLFLFDRPYDSRFIFGQNVRPVVVPPPARHPVLWWLWFELSVPQVLKKHQADVFFSPDNYCSLRADTPTLMVTHDIAHVHYPDQISAWVRRYYDRYVPRYLERAEQVIAVSDYTRTDIMRQYGVSGDKIQVACNGVRSIFQPLSEEKKVEVRARYADKQPYFFYLGAVHPRKNVSRLIRAFDRFKERTGAPHQLLIAGRLAWQTGDVKEALESAQFRSSIRLLGYLDQEELPGVLGAATALTYVSLFEGFGVPILEALHSEVPVITSNVSSMPEVAGEAALLVDPTSVEQIAAAMSKLYHEPEFVQVLVGKGRQQRGKFSWQRAAEVVYTSLQELTGS